MIGVRFLLQQGTCSISHSKPKSQHQNVISILPIFLTWYLQVRRRLVGLVLTCRVWIYGWMLRFSKGLTILSYLKLSFQMKNDFLPWHFLIFRLNECFQIIAEFGPEFGAAQLISHFDIFNTRVAQHPNESNSVCHKRLR